MKCHANISTNVVCMCTNNYTRQDKQLKTYLSFALKILKCKRGITVNVLLDAKKPKIELIRTAVFAKKFQIDTDITCSINIISGIKNLNLNRIIIIVFALICNKIHKYGCFCRSKHRLTRKILKRKHPLCL